MGFKFYGYAALYGMPDNDGDIFLPGCFSAWLRKTEPGLVPMTNGHNGPVIGTWLHIADDNLGLRVVGELSDGTGPLPKPLPGLSITPAKSKGPPSKTPQGGNYCKITDISEIALVPKPHQPLARICGEWPWF